MRIVKPLLYALHFIHLAPYRTNTCAYRAAAQWFCCLFLRGVGGPHWLHSASSSITEIATLVGSCSPSLMTSMISPSCSAFFLLNASNTFFKSSLSIPPIFYRSPHVDNAMMGALLLLSCYIFFREIAKRALLCLILCARLSTNAYARPVERKKCRSKFIEPAVASLLI